MLDKKIAYYEFWMKRPYNLSIPQVKLPTGFHFSYYQEGDETKWAKIEAAVLEFDSEEEALIYFSKEFLTFKKKLSQRMIFIENKEGEKIGTCTAWWKLVNGQPKPLVHWLAVMPDYQRQGLANALAVKVTKLLMATSPKQDVYLHTQTWSHTAVELYLKIGYQLISENIDGTYNEDFPEAIKILNEVQENN